MEGYFVDEELPRELQGEWSQGEWMQWIATPIFRGKQTSISEMLHAPNPLPYLFRAFHSLLIQSVLNFSERGQLHNASSTVQHENFEEKEKEVSSWKEEGGVL